MAGGFDLQGTIDRLLQSNPRRLDAKATQEIDDVRRAAQIRLATHAQEVAAANADAENRRNPLRRDIGIAGDSGQRQQAATTQVYDTLMSDLQQRIPSIGQPFEQAAGAVGADFQAAQAAPQAETLDGLGQQLQQMQVNTSPVGVYDQILREAQAFGQSNLQALGQGETQFAQAAVPGYGDERDVVNHGIGLETQASLADLNNQLAQIQPEFIPFNAADLQLQTEQSIRGILDSFSERDGNYSGREDVRRYAQEQGNEDIASEFLNMVAAARGGAVRDGQQISEDQVLSELLRSYTPEGLEAEYDTQQVGGRRARPLFGPSNSGIVGVGLPEVNLSLSALTEGDQAPKILHTETAESRKRRRGTQADIEQSRQMLQDLYDIYYGNYSG